MAAEGQNARRFGVAGYPVAHSRSPQMHEAAYRELGITASYQRLPIPPELFEQTVRALPGSGFAGINVTIPHKEAACQLADQRSSAVTAIGAANTLTFDSGRIFADNTDAPGLIAAITADLDGARVLVLGAGGTARAAIWALVGAGAEVCVHNRTPSRAQLLAAELGAEFVEETGGGAGYDLLVNTTSVGMDPATEEADALAALGLQIDRLKPSTTVVDFVYRPSGSPLANAARESGFSVVSGDELLARQGALAFERWFDRPAPLNVMRGAIAS